MAGRPSKTKDFPKILLRIPPALRDRVDHCQWLLQRQHGPKVTQTEALWRVLEAGCDVLTRTLEGHVPPAPAPKPLAEISSIADSVPIFLDDMPAFLDDDEEPPAPGSV